MSAGHRPRVFRSVDGCCVCGAKSSSSRFTESDRYEPSFLQCFKLSPCSLRSDEICNACVLLVKRYWRLPTGSKRCWPHVVGARAGPGLKSMMRIKSRHTSRRTATLTPAAELNTRNMSSKNVSRPGVFCGLKSRRDVLLKSQQPQRHRQTQTRRLHSGFIDPDYWTSKSVCCGVIFTGRYNELLIDTELIDRCPAHRSNPSLHFHQSAASTEGFEAPASPVDLTVCPSASLDSGNASPSSADELMDELSRDAELTFSHNTSRPSAYRLDLSHLSIHRKPVAYWQ